MYKYTRAQSNEEISGNGRDGAGGFITFRPMTSTKERRVPTVAAAPVVCEHLML